MNTGPLAETDPTPNNEYDDLAHHNCDPVHHIPDHINAANQGNQNIATVNAPASVEPRRSTRMPQQSHAGLESTEYKERESMGKSQGQDWATNRTRPQANVAVGIDTDRDDIIACLAETKASHRIPQSYKHAMATDPDRWMIPMNIEMDTLKAKHTWDLVIPPPGANIMDSMWVYNIKWDREGRRIKDKARLVGKGYTQQLGVDYNETWAGVTLVATTYIIKSLSTARTTILYLTGVFMK